MLGIYSFLQHENPFEKLPSGLISTASPEGSFLKLAKAPTRAYAPTQPNATVA
jgi:hypothetical protein